MARDRSFARLRIFAVTDFSLLSVVWTLDADLTMKSMIASVDASGCGNLTGDSGSDVVFFAAAVLAAAPVLLPLPLDLVAADMFRPVDAASEHLKVLPVDEMEWTSFVRWTKVVDDGRWLLGAYGCRTLLLVEAGDGR